MVLHGDRGTGYVRVDWFTPDGLGTWGDGRLFVLGTEGYIEVRKYADIGGRKSGNHLFIVDQKQARYIDCSNIVLPFGPQFVPDRQAAKNTRLRKRWGWNAASNEFSFQFGPAMQSSGWLIEALF